MHIIILPVTISIVSVLSSLLLLTFFVVTLLPSFPNSKSRFLFEVFPRTGKNCVRGVRTIMLVSKAKATAEEKREMLQWWQGSINQPQVQRKYPQRVWIAPVYCNEEC